MRRPRAPACASSRPTHPPEPRSSRATCPRSTCVLPARFHLARSPGAGASLAPRAMSASCTLASPSWCPANQRCRPPASHNVKMMKKNPPPLRRAPSNFRNCSQLAGTQETRRLLGERAQLSAAGGPALPGGRPAPAASARPSPSWLTGQGARRRRRRRRRRLHRAAPPGDGAAADPGAPGVRARSAWRACPAPRDPRLPRDGGHRGPGAAVRRAAGRLAGSVPSRAGEERAGAAVRTGCRAAERDSAGEERPAARGASAHGPGGGRASPGGAARSGNGAGAPGCPGAPPARHRAPEASRPIW